MGPERVMWKGVEVLRECGLEKAEVKVHQTQVGLRGRKGLLWGPDT